MRMTVVGITSVGMIENGPESARTGKTQEFELRSGDPSEKCGSALFCE
jgi:hypothetical protein